MAVATGTAVPSRATLASLNRPSGPKYITTISSPAPGIGGGPASVVQAVDLSVPLRGFRFVYKGRVGVAGANYTSVNAENILNLISQIKIDGMNSRLGSNVTLSILDLATLYALSNLTQNRAGRISVNGVLAQRPGIPYGILGPTGVTLVPLTTGGSPYDFIIVVDLPFAPFGLSGQLGAIETGFLMRNQEWKTSVTFTFTFPPVVDAGTNPLGVSAGGTTTALTAFGAGTGTPTIDIYSLPMKLGNARNSVVPGVLTRAISAFNPTVLQTANANPTELLRLQLQTTPRIYVKTGTGASASAFVTLSDAPLSALGVQIGTSTNVRDVLDWETVRQEMVEHYDVGPIQGYNCLDFIQSGNPDASYPGAGLAAGSVFRLAGTMPGTANAQGFAVQEQILLMPAGALFGK